MGWREGIVMVVDDGVVGDADVDGDASMVDNC